MLTNETTTITYSLQSHKWILGRLNECTPYHCIRPSGRTKIFIKQTHEEVERDFNIYYIYIIKNFNHV